MAPSVRKRLLRKIPAGKGGTITDLQDQYFARRTRLIGKLPNGPQFDFKDKICI
jgi:hypothetical protein